MLCLLTMYFPWFRICHRSAGKFLLRNSGTLPPPVLGASVKLPSWGLPAQGTAQGRNRGLLIHLRFPHARVAPSLEATIVAALDAREILDDKLKLQVPGRGNLLSNCSRGLQVSNEATLELCTSNRMGPD